MKWVAASVCLLIVGYCVFGFMATFEPGLTHKFAFRMGYAALGITCAIGIIRLLSQRSAD